MRKTCIIVILLLFFCGSYAQAMDISAEYACVIEATTGKVVYEKNARDTYAMASTTKIMTALLAVESGKLDEIVTASKNASNQEGSSIYLREGDKIVMRDLVYGLMLNSGNDAAVAIAEYISGDVETFAMRMTEKAKSIGAMNTQFKNPNGLDAQGHYTTAYDLSLITREAMKNDEFAKIVSTKSKKVTLFNTQADVYLSNHNKLLKQYDGVDGVKTGYTKATGRCLVSSAMRDGIRFIVVTLNAPDDWKDHSKMLDYAFDNYERKSIITAGKILKNGKTKDGQFVSISASEGFDLAVKKTQNPNCEVVLHLPNELKTPINIGEKLGVADIVYQGEVIKKIDLISQDEICENEPYKSDNISIFQCFKKIILTWFLA